MATWLQKRLKDAEKLLEQADKTAQRVVVRDPSATPLRVPGGSLATPIHDIPRGTSQQSAEVQAQRQAIPASSQRSRNKQSNSVPRPLESQSSGAGISKQQSPASNSKPPVYKPASGGVRSGQTDAALPNADAQSQPPKAIPFMQPASQPGRVGSPQPNAPAIRFMPAARSTEPPASAMADDATPPQLSLPQVKAQSDSDNSTHDGVSSNGKHPVPSLSQDLAQEQQQSPVSSQSATGDGRLLPDEAAKSSSPHSDQQTPAEDPMASMHQQTAGDQPAATASDAPDTASSVIATTFQQDAQVPAQAATQVAGSADKIAAPSSATSLSSDAMQTAEGTSPESIVEDSVEEGSPLGGESTSGLQDPDDTSGAGIQLTQREGSQAQAAAVAEAIRKAAELSVAAPTGKSVQEPTVESGAGPGREVLLTRLVDQLKGRLQTYKEENQQLEEMLHQSDARASGSMREVDRLEDALAKAQAERLSAEAALAHSSTEQQGQVQVAQQALQAATRDLADCQARVADLESTNALLIQESQVSEGRILAALQDEVTAAEARLEEERAAHISTQRTAAAREQAVQSSMAEGATALASMQRLVEERTQQASSAQQALMQAQQDQASLTARLRTAQDQAALRQDTEDDSRQAELQAQVEQLQHEKHETAQFLTAADSQLAEARSEAQQLQQTVHDLQRRKQDRGYDDLQSRFKEVTELLYTKQTQLERMAAEKAAQQLAHEREVAHAKDDAERVKRRVRTERASSSFTSNLDDVVVPMDSLGEAFDRLANDNRVGSYVKAGARALDATASAAVRLIKQYPLGRLFVFVYIVSIHLFIYILIDKMQTSAVDHSSHPTLTLDDLNSRM